MTESDSSAYTPARSSAVRSTRRGLPILLVAVGVLGVAQAAAWFHFRRSQPITDELTRERLQPRSDM